MKNEFNFKVLTKTALTVQAAAIAAPAVVLTALQYGWPGLVVAGAFVAGVDKAFDGIEKIRSQFNHPVLRLFNHGHTFLGTPFHPDSSPQKMCDALVEKRGGTAVKVHMLPWLVPYAGRASEKDIISITPPLLDLLDEGEMKSVMAHEVEHGFQPDVPDFRLQARTMHVFTASSFVASVTGLAANNLHSLGTLSGFFAIAAASVATSCFTQMAANAPGRTIEYRCDENALRINGDLPAAIGAMEKTDEVANGFFDGRLGDMIGRTLFRLESRHPSSAARIRNLEKTYAKMQLGK